MHFWNAGALADELREDSLTEDTKLRYFLAVTALSYLTARPGILEMLQTTVEGWVALSYVVVGFLGTYACFLANARGDGQRFIERFMCLSWPVLLRWVVLTYGILAI